MSLLQSGCVGLGILGAAEADKYGNLNSTQVHADNDSRSLDRFTRLPGSGGACDIASCAKRFIVLLSHSKRRLPERVSYITSPGYGDGGDWRQRVGLPRGGPSACITTKAVLRYFDPTSPHPGFARDRVPDHGEAYLASVHPGVTVEDVVANTGWELRVPDNIVETSPPTAEELAAIRDYDKEGFWTK
jgi:glutaconate CoA-transferase subunit B